MGSLLVFGSEDCMAWEDTVELIEQLESSEDFYPAIECLDPVEHNEKFQEYNLVICPSFVYEGELIAVGPSTPEDIKSSVEELEKNQIKE
ncbi:MAG: hypothetical protein ABEJ65_04975 [bacterium]